MKASSILSKFLTMTSALSVTAGTEEMNMNESALEEELGMK